MTLDEIQALCDAATPGPWKASDAVKGAIEVHSQRWDRTMNLFHTDVEGYAIVDVPDATFIAAARTLMPRFVAVARVAKRVRESEVVRNAPFATYSESLRLLDDTLDALEAP